MKFSRLGRGILIAGTSLALTASAGFAAASASTVAKKKPHHATHGATAVSALSSRPDSGDNGNWALDKMSRKATVTLVGTAAATNCGGHSPCYHWHGLVTDKGTFTTIAGATSPGAGDLNGGSAPTMATAVTGPMHGSYNYDFYASTTKVNAKSVTRKESGNPTGDKTTCLWVEQFFPAGTGFWDNTGSSTSGCLGTTGGWTYTLGFGADKACPNLASQWVDGSPSWGTDPTTGNILVPDKSHC